MTEQLELFAAERSLVRVTVGDALGIFWDLHYQFVESASHNKSHFKALSRGLGGLYVDVLTELDVRAYLRGRQAGKLNGRAVSGATLNKERNLLVSLYGKLYRWKKAGNVGGYNFAGLLLPIINPIEDVKPEPETPDKQTTSRNHLSMFLEHAHEDILDIVIFERFTLLRKGNLVKLKVTDLNREQRLITILQGKTKKPKDIHANDQLIAIFDKAVKEGRTHVLNFLNFRRRWNEAIQKAKIPRFTLRRLRKTRATELYQATKDIKLVQEALGHTTPLMTDRYIVRQKKEIIRIDKVLQRI